MSERDAGTDDPGTDRDATDRIQAHGPDGSSVDQESHDTQQMGSMPPEPHGSDDDPASYVQG